MKKLSKYEIELPEDFINNLEKYIKFLFNVSGGKIHVIKEGRVGFIECKDIKEFKNRILTIALDSGLSLISDLSVKMVAEKKEKKKEKILS